MSDNRDNGHIERVPEPVQHGTITITILPDGNVGGFQANIPFPLAPTGIVGAMDIAKAMFIQQAVTAQARPSLAIPNGVIPRLR